MKPINLKIKGLNSFIETQEVDFEKLTERGLFGIFGPTGSGKSTILDGITLALYGEVSRKSSNFMNTNCDTMNVSYEFKIHGNEIKHYKVDRDFKRDNKTGNVRSKSAKITEISGDSEFILEEGATKVNDKCVEIIGLKLEDFTRTVVLPQGKFSEFLKLEGKDRRNMLERLFNLQKYGDDLSYKLGRRIKAEKEKYGVLEGELNGFDDINQETIKLKENILFETKEELSKCRTEVNEAEKNYSEGKELWNFINELKELTGEEKQLKERENYIIDIQKKVTSGESALKVKPYIDSYENTLNQMKSVEEGLSQLKTDLEILKGKKQSAESWFNSAKIKKDNELPELRIKEQKISDAISEKSILDNLVKEKNRLVSNITILKGDLKKTADSLSAKDKNINILTDSINENEKKAEILTASEEYKNKINDGIILLNKYTDFNKRKNKLAGEINTAISNIKQSREKSDFLSKNINETETKINILEKNLKGLTESCPGDQNTLLSIQYELSQAKNNWNKYNEYTASADKSRSSAKNLQNSLELRIKEKEDLTEQITSANDIIKKIETENIAHSLRESLSDGNICPVCGSKNHDLSNIQIINTDSCNLEKFKSDLKIKEDRNNKLASEIVTIQTNISTEEKNINEVKIKITELGDDFKSVLPEIIEQNFIKLKEDINRYTAQKTDLEEKIRNTEEKRNKLCISYNKENAVLNQIESQLEKLKEDLKESESEFKITKDKLFELRSELAVENFEAKRDEITRQENERSVVENKIKSLRNKFKSEQNEREELNLKYSDLNLKFKELCTISAEKDKSIEERKNSIIEKAGNTDNLEKLMAGLAANILKIQKDYNESEIQLKKIENSYNECSSKIISGQDSLHRLNERSIKDKEYLENILSEEAIGDIEKAKADFLDKAEINELKSQIDEYKNSATKLSGMMDSLKKKINNRSLTEENWIQIQKVRNEKKELLNILTEKAINLGTEVKIANERLKKKKELLKEKKELDYKLGLLDDLEKLFKGKKFVEFVAANQLKYVSMEANKKLMEITGGNYGLEVDENGKFLIRDYKNGGSTRDASTLSGGETFVTSLALALALSAQIQLKGTAPLELFFLDEGFGTLDDNLLDVVMDSLERIYNSKLSIGIISHIESIKNRVPVKLLVSAAKAGMGGSKVKIDIS